MIGSSQGTHLIWEILTKSNLGSRDQKHLTLVTSLSGSHIQNPSFLSNPSFINFAMGDTNIVGIIDILYPKLKKISRLNLALK